MLPGLDWVNWTSMGRRLGLEVQSWVGMGVLGGRFRLDRCIHDIRVALKTRCELSMMFKRTDIQVAICCASEDVLRVPHLDAFDARGCLSIIPARLRQTNTFNYTSMFHNKSIQQACACPRIRVVISHTFPLLPIIGSLNSITD